MSLKLYFDCSASSPSRALYIFLRKNCIPFEPKVVDIRKGDQHRAEYHKINPMKKIPVIEHNGFLLTESSTILRYLCREFDVEDHWYPRDSQARARVDERFDWHQSTLKFHGLNVYFAKYWSAMMNNASTEPETYERHEQQLLKGCDRMDKLLLSDNAFLTGSQMTIADLFCACDLDQMRLTGLNPRENRPRLSAWLDRVAGETAPYYQEAHASFHELVEQVEQSLMSRSRVARKL